MWNGVVRGKWEGGLGGDSWVYTSVDHYFSRDTGRTQAKPGKAGGGFLIVFLASPPPPGVFRRVITVRTWCYYKLLIVTDTEQFGGSFENFP